MKAEEESAWLRAIAARLESHAKELEQPEPAKVGIERQLEALGWVEAKSKKCDYCKDAPSDLVAALRALPGGFVGSGHYFNVSSSEPTIFRFPRRAK